MGDPTTEQLIRWAHRVPAPGDPDAQGRWGDAWRVVRVLVERRAANSLKGCCELYLERAGLSLKGMKFQSFYVSMTRRAKRSLGADYQRKYFPS